MRTELSRRIQHYFKLFSRQELAEELITTISDELFVHLNNSQTPIPIEVQKEIVQNLLIAKLQEVPFGGISYRKNILMF